MERQPLDFQAYANSHIRAEAEAVSRMPTVSPEVATYVILERVKRKGNPAMTLKAIDHQLTLLKSFTEQDHHILDEMGKQTLRGGVIYEKDH